MQIMYLYVNKCCVNGAIGFLIGSAPGNYRSLSAGSALYYTYHCRGYFFSLSPNYFLIFRNQINHKQCIELIKNTFCYFYYRYFNIHQCAIIPISYTKFKMLSNQLVPLEFLNQCIVYLPVGSQRPGGFQEFIVVLFRESLQWHDIKEAISFSEQSFPTTTELGLAFRNGYILTLEDMQDRKLPSACAHRQAV